MKWWANIWSPPGTVCSEKSSMSSAACRWLLGLNSRSGRSQVSGNRLPPSFPWNCTKLSVIFPETDTRVVVWWISSAKAKKDYSHLKLFFLLCVFRTLTITSFSYSRLIGNVKWFMIMNNLDCNTNQVTLTFHLFIAVTERQQQVDGSFLLFLVTNVQTYKKTVLVKNVFFPSP